MLVVLSLANSFLCLLLRSKPEPTSPLSTPDARAVENGGLNTSPESSARTPPSHQPRLLRVRSSQLHGCCHQPPLLSNQTQTIFAMTIRRSNSNAQFKRSHVSIARLKRRCIGQLPTSHRSVLPTRQPKYPADCFKIIELRLEDYFRDQLRA